MYKREHNVTPEITHLRHDALPKWSIYIIDTLNITWTKPKHTLYNVNWTLYKREHNSMTNIFGPRHGYFWIIFKFKPQHTKEHALTTWSFNWFTLLEYAHTTHKKKFVLGLTLHNKTKERFESRVFGRPTFWETCASVVNHEDVDS